MKSMDTPEGLIVTETISLGYTPYVAIRNPKERLFQYLYSLGSWIKLTNIEKIVFCEKSNTIYDFKRLIDFTKAEGKDLEVLVFNGNDIAQRLGKGIGEGTIMEYVMENSQYLVQDESFYKITGRKFIENFESIQTKYSQYDTLFKYPGYILKQGSRRWHPRNLKQNYRMYLFSLRFRGLKNPHYINSHVAIDFYKSNVKFFRKNLISLYKKINDNIPYWQEHAFYDALKNKFQIMLEKPNVVGRRGSNGDLVIV